MFPKVLATGAFSLNAGQDCCAMSIGALVHPDGSFSEATVTPSRVTVAQRMTYEEVDTALESAEAPPEGTAAADLLVLNQVSFAKLAVVV